MKFFSKEESIWVVGILTVVFVASLFNFRISLRRARDSQRKDDIRSLFDTVSLFREEVGFMPKGTSDGKIIACIGPETKITPEGIANLVPCRWGADSIVNPYEETKVYLKVLPVDPRNSEGFSYFYLTNGRWFQIYASLEGKNEAEYDEKIAARRLICGLMVCNFGRSYGNIPLDKSFEEYENEIREKNQEL